jgi:hypothetical protein
MPHARDSLRDGICPGNHHEPDYPEPCQFRVDLSRVTSGRSALFVCIYSLECLDLPFFFNFMFSIFSSARSKRSTPRSTSSGPGSSTSSRSLGRRGCMRSLQLGYGSRPDIRRHPPLHRFFVNLPVLTEGKYFEEEIRGMADATGLSVPAGSACSWIGGQDPSHPYDWRADQGQLLHVGTSPMYHSLTCFLALALTAGTVHGAQPLPPPVAI